MRLRTAVDYYVVTRACPQSSNHAAIYVLHLSETGCILTDDNTRNLTRSGLVNTMRHGTPCGGPPSGRRSTAVIHQPYFLPWLGYFSKLSFCDVFVVLDNVNFTKQHYLDRTKIVDMHGDVTWLSLPAGQNFEVPIRNVALQPPDSRSMQKIIDTVRTSYSKALKFDLEWPYLEQLFTTCFLRPELMLLDINMSLITGLLNRLGIPIPRTVFASEITTARDPTARLCDICDALEITDLLIGAGRSRVVHDLDSLRRHRVSIRIQDYTAMHPIYSQSRRRFSGFVSGLSIVDALLNVGSNGVRTFVSDERYSPAFLFENYAQGGA